VAKENKYCICIFIKKQDMQYNYNIHFRCPENDLKFYKLCFEIYQMAVNQMCITFKHEEFKRSFWCRTEGECIFE
jgi:hypothetical protein